MKKILLGLLLLTSTAFAALTEVDKSIYSERNLIINPGFENGKNSWLSSSATLTATTTAANVLYGAASGSILISTNGGYVRTKTVAVPTALYGQACEARVLYKGGDALTTFEVYNRDNELLGSLALKALSAPGYESVFFPCPTAAQVSGDADDGFIYAQIKQTSAGTHTVMYTDSWYMGGLSMLGETTLPDVFSAKISSTGIVSLENTDLFNGNCSVASTNEFTCNFNSGLFSVAPVCVATIETPTATNGAIAMVNSVSSSVVVFETVRHDATATAYDMYVHCNKSSVDAKQSVQVYKSIPKVAQNENDFSAKVTVDGSVATVDSENIDWINGNCVRNGTGDSTCTFIANTFSVAPVCTATVSSAATGVFAIVSAVSASSVQIKTITDSVGQSNNAYFLRCSKQSTDFKMPVVQPIYSPATVVGAVVGSTYFQTGAVATGSTQIPTDDTAIQNTEGTEFFTVSYAPKSATNLLRIKAIGNFGSSGSAVCAMALFQDSIANALAASFTSIVASNAESIPLTHTMVAGTTASITFKIRAGCGTASTLTLNGVSGGRYYAGAMASSITVEEIQQ